MDSSLIVGIVIGIAASALAVVIVMRSKMLTVYRSRLGFGETVAALEKAIQDAGWVLSDSKLLNDNLSKHGVDFTPRVHLIKLCKAEYAAEVLKDNRHVACLMPCTIAVYETDDGKVNLSKMNTGLMGKVFGGSIARVMGGKVAADEKVLLRDIVG